MRNIHDTVRCAYNPQVKIKMKNGKLVKRDRATVGGDWLTYDGPTSTLVAAMETIRLLLNAIVSVGASLMCINIKDYCLGTPLVEPEYMSKQVQPSSASA